MRRTTNCGRRWRSRRATCWRSTRASASTPAWRAIKKLYDEGKVAIVQGVGYPNPDHSHFRSTEIWQTAAPDRYVHTGWLGRYFDETPSRQSNLFRGVAVSKVLPEVMVSQRTDIPAIPGLGQYAMIADDDSSSRDAYAAQARDRRLPFQSPYLAHVMEIESDAQRSSEELPKLVAGYVPKAAYPATGIGRSLALAAQIIGSKLGTRAIYVEHGSFDTHVGQQKTQNNLLAQFSEAIGAFYDDLAAHGNENRVLTLTFSEFGRRIEENGNRGTDHGEASPLFLIGGGVRGGIYGTYPDLSVGEYGQRALHHRFSQRLRYRAGTLARPFAVGRTCRRFFNLARSGVSASILFLGSGGARFVVARQLRASGGMWMRFGATQIHVDPGPGALVRALSHVPPCNPRELDAIVLSHKHLDHSNDVNAMIEAMTSGGFVRRGAVLAPEDAFDEEPVVLPYARRFPERIERLTPSGGPWRIGEVELRTSMAHEHAVQTYGLHFSHDTVRVSYLPCGRYFDGLAQDYAAHRPDVLVVNVLRLADTLNVDHFTWHDAKRVVLDVRPKVVIFQHFGTKCWKQIPTRLAAEFEDESGLRSIAAYDGFTVDVETAVAQAEAGRRPGSRALPLSSSRTRG